MRKKQVVGMLLAMSMSIALLPAEAWAAKGNSRQEATTEVVGQEDVDNQSHRLETKPDGQIVDGTDKWETFQIPDIIEKGEVKEKGYIGRVFESEKDLNTFVFQNSDGSNTMRIYDYPVKYVDENGDIRDITTDISKCADGAYVTKENTIKTRFPKYFREGIELTSDNVNIQLVPKGMDNASKFASKYVPVSSLDDKTVSYSYGTNTTLEYELTYTGFKEDIVVSQYTGQTEYEFTIHTNGLYLSEEDGSYYLVDDEGTVQATIGDIIIFTADEANNAMGSMTSVTIEDGQEYLLTIHVDGEYLRDEKTVYPIRIDPTIEVNYDNNGAGAIEDVTLNENSGSSGTSGSLYIGKRSTYGKSRTLMKFPTLNLSSVYSESYITSATVEIRDLLCQSTAMTVQCYVFNGNTWSESSANWSNVSPGSYTTLLSSNSISYANGAKQSTAHRYKFDITAVVKGWKSGTYTQAKGIMFKAADSVENGSTYLYKTFGSYNRASYKPSLTVTYEVGTSNVSLSMDGNYVAVGQTKAINYTKSPSDLSIVWKVNDTRKATINGNIITGKAPGVITVTATYKDFTTGKDVTKAISVEVIETLGVEQTEYFIMNYSNGQYMMPASSTISSGTNVVMGAKTIDDIAKWNIVKSSNGRYYITSSASSTNYMLNASGTNINIKGGSIAATELFVLERENGDTYDGMYTIRYGKYYVTRSTSGTPNNVYLSTKLTEQAYWSLIEVTDEEKEVERAYLVYTVCDINTVFAKSSFESNMPYMGYEAAVEKNDSSTNMYNALDSSPDIWISLTHGFPGGLSWRNEENTTLGTMSVNEYVVSEQLWRDLGEEHKYLSDMPSDRLAGVRAVFYLGCETGVDFVLRGNVYNLVDATYEKGAQFVLGTTREILVDESEDFWEAFWPLIVNKKMSIKDAIETMKDDSMNLSYLYYRGDNLQYIHQ